MHTPRSTSHRRTVESNEALGGGGGGGGDRETTSWTQHRLKIRPQRAKSASPGQHETGAGVVGARARGTPLDGVDLLAVRLQVVDTRVLLHAPDLKRDTGQASQHPFVPVMSTLPGGSELGVNVFSVQHRSGSHLQSHVVGTGGQQAACGVPLDGVHLVLQNGIVTGTSTGAVLGQKKGGVFLSRLTVCPWKVLTGRSWPSLHTWMHMSVLQDANVLLLCQSTSRAGADGGQRRERLKDC